MRCRSDHLPSVGKGIPASGMLGRRYVNRAANAKCAESPQQALIRSLVKGLPWKSQSFACLPIAKRSNVSISLFRPSLF